MFNHALKLVWNRRRANALVAIEIAAAFVVTFVLLALALKLWSSYRQPLGFEYENVWSVQVDQEATGGFAVFTFTDDDFSGTLLDVTAALRALPRTESVEPIEMSPFLNYRWNTRFGADADNVLLTNVNRSTTEGLQNIGVSLVAGRWFTPADEGANYRAVLVNRMFAERAFGSVDAAVGRQIGFPDPTVPIDQLPEWQAREVQRPARAVGVIEDFRQWGEFQEPQLYAIQLHEPTDVRGRRFNLFLKVAPGTDAGFEEDIISTVESTAPGWTAAVTSWEELRATRHADTLLPIKASSTVGVFFIALVVMGLIGVVWQDVVRRTQEIGLRRALGASAARVQRQIQLEMLVVGGFGIVFGSVVALQFPLLEVVDDIDWAASLPAIVLAAVFIVILVALGALYPSWLASRREPADALRYE